jgi:molecular chaperone DnaJ
MGGFGGARGRQGQYSREVRGRDVRKDLEIELEDAFNGKEMTLDVETYQTCPVCYGRRVKPGSGYKQCQACQGAGMLRSVQNTVFGQFVSSTTCNKCQGAGQIPDELCLECDGLGKTKNKRKISVNIPRGIDNGQRIRITGEGEAGEFGGPAGDLYIFIYVKEHDFLKRSGRDLVADLPVGFADAALGSEKEIQSIDGPVKVEIKEGTQPGTVLTIKGKGMPDLRDGARGDMLVRVNVVTPTKLTRKQRDLLCQFAEEGPQFHCEKKGFLGKILDAITGKN